ncbi:MAG: hypothetical protein KDA78_10270 [Planctomycetaceae bacterium]|nr:hypothetical protein [Planctomycetaceae bacterium]
MSRSYPTMLRIERTAPTQEAIDPARQASSELKKLLDNSDIRPGQRIGILVGSRGIAGLREIITTVVDSLIQAGLKPALIPAMGSHGGATSAGQTEVLKNLGLDELLKTVPCLNTMDTEIIGTFCSG